MDIELHPVTIREVVDGYTDDGEGGVFGYGGRLNIRPPYQREFVYKQKQRDAVIDTIFKGFPLNVFYWVENEDGTFTRDETLSHGEAYGLCSDQRFIDQPISAFCSGTLIAPDAVLTAGHCVRSATLGDLGAFTWCSDKPGNITQAPQSFAKF